MTAAQDLNAPVRIPKNRVKSVAIIGAGASGSVAVDVFNKEGYDKIKVFERRGDVSGVWHLDSKVDEIPVAPGSNETKNDEQLEIPIELETQNEVFKPRSTVPRFIYTPAYENIRTNVPEHFMTFSDKPTWPGLDQPDVDPFTLRKYVDQYIQEYIEPNKEFLTLNTTLEKVDKDYSDPDSKFTLTLRTETNEKDSEGNLLDRWFKEKFDALVLANGHYHVPHIPYVEGLNKVIAKFPERVKYAKQFRHDPFYKDKTVLVVGGSASGIDISYVLTKVAKKVYRSQPTKSWEERQKQGRFVLLIDQQTELKPTITRYELNDKDEIIAHFEDGSIVSNPDYIIYGTGYDYSYPFLRHLFPDFSDEGVYLPHSFQHTFHIQDPLISTLGVPVGALSFRAFEYQSILISRFLSGKIALPSINEQYKWVHEREERIGKIRGYHRIGGENVVGYLQDLTELGGGVEQIDGTGRLFPIVTQEQVDEWAERKSKLVNKWEADVQGATQGIENL
ncbi:hypothetical protein WICMUC_000934 [Wickerhamomyces mucosus]|uniref:Flavin-containing monooxygenase n=1 Tax=Wickerhamomyces mucosus TaxID=1378264 RepID=A0A9P8THY7_9ASCO|nr:hypothetical protein WICMUC_000934 [Wickerhamomyces mucosus]